MFGCVCLLCPVKQEGSGVQISADDADCARCESCTIIQCAIQSVKVSKDCKHITEELSWCAAIRMVSDKSDKGRD